jgi:phenylacetic acid degradation operon negative regulatory protein
MSQAQASRNTRDRERPGAPVGLLDRPLSARSVIASLLLGMDRPRMRGALLVRWCGLFRVREGAARVALSRMTAAGELRAAGGTYELAGRLSARRREQEWMLAPTLLDWSGGWRLAVVAPGARPPAERQARRDALRHLRLVELREGVWTRPDNLPADAYPRAARDVVDVQCTWWDAHPPDSAAVAAGFGAPAWARDAGALVARLDAVRRDLDAGDAGLVADAFVVGAAALVHVRADPLLPAPLLPPAWPGDALRDAYRAYRESFAAASAAWFRRLTA